MEEVNFSLQILYLSDGALRNFSIEHKNYPFVQITVTFSVCNETTTERQCQSEAGNDTCENNYCTGNSDVDIIFILTFHFSEIDIAKIMSYVLQWRI